MFAFLVSSAVRGYLWHRYKIYVQVQALQISPLAGRIFFKGLRYHGDNETIIINDGYLTWRYWLRRVREVELNTQEQGGANKDGATSTYRPGANGDEPYRKTATCDLPCRLEAQIRGVEWFIYNRSPAYDPLLAHMSKSKESSAYERTYPRTQSCHNEDLHAHTSCKLADKEFAPMNSNSKDVEDKLNGSRGSRTNSTSSNSEAQQPDVSTYQEKSSPAFLAALPIRFECDRGAVIMGNENTRSILVARFDSSIGHIDARTSTALDDYRQCIDMDFVHPVVQIKPNRSFKEGQISTALKSHEPSNGSLEIQYSGLFTSNYHRIKVILSASVARFLPRLNFSCRSRSDRNMQASKEHRAGVIDQGQSKWLGLTRYLDEDDETVEQEKWKAIEYGRESTIVDSPAVGVTLYWDAPGRVLNEALRPVGDEYNDNINRAAPPAWVVEVRVRGGNISYGPWADRQRLDLQAVFFPTLYADSSPTPVLPLGANRISTMLKIIVEIEEDVTLRIPTREESKDWRWRGKEAAEVGSDINHKRRTPFAKSPRRGKGAVHTETRSAGWLDIAVAANSTVRYVMGLFPGENGYKNRLDLDLRNPMMSTSVNQGLFWRCQTMLLTCDVSNPLEWRMIRDWYFDIQSDDFELFIIRDHIFLLTDLVSDWASGPAGEFYTFIPYNYILKLRISGFRIYLNVNDCNIINKPSDLEDNTFIVIWGEQLTGNLFIPLVNFQPVSNSITFDVDAYHGGFRVIFPSWNTKHDLLDTPDVASLEDLKINGSYNYYSTTSPSLTDSLFLNICGFAPTAHLHGFLIRLFMKVKDNYFGEDLHFRTMEEYQEQYNKQKSEANTSSSDSSHTTLTSDLDVIINLSTENACAMLPSSLYSASENIKLDISCIAADLRFTNYYMDLAVSISPLAVTRATIERPQTFTAASDSSTQVFIDGMTVYGHRLFGLPPVEPTYVCNWDFSIGPVSGECSGDFLRGLAQADRCFGYSFADCENTLPPLHLPMLHDVTFLRAKVDSLCLWLVLENSAFMLGTEKLNISYNDWAGQLHSEKFRLLLPDLTLAIVESITRSRKQDEHMGSVNTHAYMHTSLIVHGLDRKANFHGDRQLQQDHLELQDKRSNRVPWLLHVKELLHGKAPDQSLKVRSPAMIYPPMPFPVTPLAGSIVPSISTSSTGSSIRSSLSRHPGGGKSSFLTSSTPPPQRRIQDLPLQSQASLGSNRESLTAPQLENRSTISSNAQIDSARRLSSNVTFSSSYEMPNFPYQSVKFDLSDVPELPTSRPDEDESSDWEMPELSDDHKVHKSLIIQSRPGIRAYCSPQGIDDIGVFLEMVQNKKPSEILDEVHISTMRRAISKEGKNIGKNEIKRFTFRLPYLHVRFKFMTQSSNIEETRENRLDMIANSTSVTAGSGPMSSNGSGIIGEDIFSIHTLIRHMIVSGTAWVERDIDNAASLYGEISNVSFWAAKTHDLSSEFRFRDLDFVTNGERIGLLISLIEYTSTLAKLKTEKFSEIFKIHKARARYLILALITSSVATADPPFLTGASYLLRNAVGHPRTTDTWKMLSRLRTVCKSLSKSDDDSITEQCLQSLVRCNKQTALKVADAFRNWRVWDLKDVHNSALMQSIYGSLLELTSPHSKILLIKASIVGGGLRFAIGTESKQSLFAIEKLSLGIRLNDTGESEPRPISQTASNEQISIAEVTCGKIVFRLNWDILRIMEDLLPQLKNSELDQSEVRAEFPSAPSSTQEAQILHVVVASETNLFIVESPTFGLVSLADGLMMSCINPNAAAGLVPEGLNGLIHVNSITTEVRHDYKIMLRSKLNMPTISSSLGSYSIDGTHLPLWTWSGSCREISIDAQEDIRGLIKFVGHILDTEVVTFLSFIKPFTHHVTSKQSSAQVNSSNHHSRFQTALFLDSYKISIVLLPVLLYQLAGKVARSSLRPHQRQISKIVLDFDAKECLHSFVNNGTDTSHEIAALPGPRSNGRLVMNLDSQGRSITTYAAIESIELNASAVLGLLTSLNNPEISRLLQTLGDDIESLKFRYQIISTSKQAQKPAESSRPHSPFRYDARLTTAGLSIIAVTPESGRGSIKLLVDFGPTAMRATNQDRRLDMVKGFPEMIFGMQDFKILLQQSSGNDIHQYGDLKFAAFFRASSKPNEAFELVRSYNIESNNLEINLHAETAYMIVHVLRHLQDSFKAFEIPREIRDYRRQRRHRTRPRATDPESTGIKDTANEQAPTRLFTSMYAIEINSICVCWRVGDSTPLSPGHAAEDLMLSFTRIVFSTRKNNAARLKIIDFQLQMVPSAQTTTARTFNSAVLPEVVFNVAYLSGVKDRRFAFQAAGKSLDLRLTSHFILPATDLQRSIGLATDELRAAVSDFNNILPHGQEQTKNRLGGKKLSSLLVDADFAGAVVYVQGKKVSESRSAGLDVLRIGRLPQHGRYGQFTQEDTGSSTTLRAPGIALKVEYNDTGLDDPSLNAELKVDASSNMLYPTVVPLILEISSSIKEIVGEPTSEIRPAESKSTTMKFLDEGTLKNADPRAILGKCRLNLGLRICKQDFSLSCQPIARVAATAQFESIYLTVNTVQSVDHGRFFAISCAFNRLQASIQHAYSRDSTGSFDVDSIVISLMNSKHVSSTKGLSTILRISPMRAQINVKQLQDFLLFREIWVPIEMRHSTPSPSTPIVAEQQGLVVQRYQQVAAASAFPWNATVFIAGLDIQLDLGQSLGKSTFNVTNFWVSSKKRSNWEQILCLGIESIRINSKGRLSGLIDLQKFNLRTSIQWPAREAARNQTPLIQASLGFNHLRVKAAFDFQVFTVMDITSFELLMYNVREDDQASADRLVGIVNGESVQVFLTTNSAAQGLALAQTFERLVQEKRTAYETSLRDIEKYIRRTSTVSAMTAPQVVKEAAPERKMAKIPNLLHTDVVVTLNSIKVGAFPSTFFDNQIFKMEALDASARFAVVLDNGRIHSGLGLTLGQLRIALSSIAKPAVPKPLGEVSVEEVVSVVNDSRGGIILRVPKVLAYMQTWQMPDSTLIDYIFRSSFEGKVDVGWNYSRISFIRGMWNNHVRALAQRLGKPLPKSAVQITGGLQLGHDEGDKPRPEGEQEKITAVVHMPQSKYQYTPLEPPIIETPQLRDMGEATPPLEWIGLHRERLPNLTHQIVIVALLGVAKEVEDAYARILGSS